MNANLAYFIIIISFSFYTQLLYIHFMRFTFYGFNFFDFFNYYKNEKRSIFRR